MVRNLVNSLPPSPHPFSDLRILKDFKSFVFGSADCKGVTGEFFGSADSEEVRGFAGLNAGTLEDSAPHPRGICMSVILKGLLEGQFGSDGEQRGCCEGLARLV
jgi:hypothetical protein